MPVPGLLNPVNSANNIIYIDSMGDSLETDLNQQSGSAQMFIIINYENRKLRGWGEQKDT
jgi:hypothetical protein